MSIQYDYKSQYALLHLKIRAAQGQMFPILDPVVFHVLHVNVPVQMVERN